MYDGAQLALGIADHPDDIEAALAAYEDELFPRSAHAAGESARSLNMLFSDDSPAGLVAMFEQFDKQATEDQDGAQAAATQAVA